MLLSAARAFLGFADGGRKRGPKGRDARSEGGVFGERAASPLPTS